MTGSTTSKIIIAGAAILDIVGFIALILLRNSGLETGGLVVGASLLLLITLPAFGLGVFLLYKSRAETAENELVSKQRQLLDMVTARGELRISDAALELQSPKSEVQRWVYNLVGLGVFNGYINWDDGVLYSSEAAQLKDLTECKRCGGEVALAGKGVTKCKHCGTEYYLS